ncbi:PKD domain-containing protein [Methanosarcina vacuolata]|nr:PKD domain-containing protein [Methanosarcina vacuolata]
MNYSKIVICCFLISIITCTVASSAESLPESDHPYANNFDYTWPAIEESGATQMRLHFTKLSIADYRDKLTILDTEGNKLVTYDRSNNGDDFWTDWYTEDAMKVRLQTDGSDTAYGFKIDQVETRTDMAPPSTLPESYHSYANNFDYTWPIISEPGATQMRLHFTKLSIADYRDKLTILDTEGNKLVTYDRSNNGDDFWTDWYTEDTMKVKLQTDGSDTAYGFKIDQVETRTDMAPPSTLPESYHSYANNFDYTWPIISEPGATQMRLHFTKLSIADYRDKLTILDKEGNKLVTYDRSNNGDDFWTDWYTEDAMKVRLQTDGSDTAYGFKIDQVETRTDMAPPSTLPESYHSYANNFDYTWPIISESGATQMRLHFTKLSIADYRDKLTILDKEGNKLVTYDRSNNGDDFWTDWYTEDTMKVKLQTDGSDTAYGFKIDNVETKPEKPTPPIADFSASPTSGNAPLKVTFTDKSSNSPTSWKWTFGDGKTSTEQNPVHTYTKAGTYTVVLTASNAGGSNTVTKSKYITVKTAPIKPVAAFSATPTSGNAPLKVQFTDKSTGSPTSWKWTFGDGKTSTVKTPVHTYSKEGKYTVSLTVKNAAGTNTKTIKNYITVKTVPIKPVAAFSATPTSGKAPLKVQFTDKSTGSPTSWKWSFGDGKTSTVKTPVHTYSKEGKYTVSLTVKNAAGTNTKTIKNYITVKTAPIKPVASFSATPTSGKAPLKVQFTDKSTGSPTSWKWSFGDGTYSIKKNPSYTYDEAGKYTVSLTVKNAAGTNTKTIKNYIVVK